MTELPDYDVMIVGGGPAGISTWLHLRWRNPELAERALVVERAFFPRDKPCGGGLTPRADLVLSRLGVRIDVPSVAIHKVLLRFGEKEHRLSKKNLFRVVRRREYDQALAQSAVDAGLRLREGEAFRSFERSGDRLLVTTSQGKYRVRILVGADGAGSVVRRLMARGEDPCISPLLEVLTPLNAATDFGLEDATAVFDFGAVTRGLQGYVWHFPCLEDGTAAMSRGIYDSRVDLQRPQADLRQIFRSELEKRGVEAVPEHWRGHPGRRFSADAALSQDNVLLVGDAAGSEAAFGEGISRALQYGDVAAAAIAKAFAEEDFRLGFYKSDLLDHPLGQQLTFSNRLAKQMYSDGQTLEELYGLLSMILTMEETVTDGAAAAG